MRFLLILDFIFYFFGAQTEQEAANKERVEQDIWILDIYPSLYPIYFSYFHERSPSLHAETLLITQQMEARSFLMC